VDLFCAVRMWKQLSRLTRAEKWGWGDGVVKSGQGLMGSTNARLCSQRGNMVRFTRWDEKIKRESVTQVRSHCVRIYANNFSLPLNSALELYSTSSILVHILRRLPIQRHRPLISNRQDDTQLLPMWRKPRL
jgi:hypothetical protein